MNIFSLAKFLNYKYSCDYNLIVQTILNDDCFVTFKNNDTVFIRNKTREETYCLWLSDLMLEVIKNQDDSNNLVSYAICESRPSYYNLYKLFYWLTKGNN